MKRNLLFFAMVLMACALALIVFNKPNPVNRKILRYVAPIVKDATHTTFAAFGHQSVPELGRLKIAIAAMKPVCLKFNSLGFFGLLLFFGTTGFLYWSDKTRFRARTWLVIVLLGIPYIFLWNTFRIAATMMASHRIEERWGQSPKAYWAISFVYSNLGWVFYAVAISLFFTLWMKSSRRFVWLR